MVQLIWFLSPRMLCPGLQILTLGTYSHISTPYLNEFLELNACENLLSLQKLTACQILSDFPILMYDNQSGTQQNSNSKLSVIFNYFFSHKMCVEQCKS